MKKRFVVDSNIIVSTLLIENSTPSKALKKARDIGTIIISDEVILEFQKQMNTKKFDPYISQLNRIRFISKLGRESLKIEITEKITACRDPKDNKFLELAVCSQADCLISGDEDLLVLHPFQSIPILNAHDFLRTF